jgi:hypothetical protein
MRFYGQIMNIRILFKRLIFTCPKTVNFLKQHQMQLSLIKVRTIISKDIGILDTPVSQNAPSTPTSNDNEVEIFSVLQSSR